MKKWIIFWDAGYGQSAEVIEAETREEAQNRAYEAWNEEAQDNADWRAEPWTQELEDDYT